MIPQGVLLSMNGSMGLHSCIAQVDFERDHGMPFMNLFKPMLCLAFQLAYACIQCTDASWPASYYDAYTGNQDQHLAPR
ncbi:hypothetical protein MTR67_053315 [Solanum verrucosum]|uniref:Uncharacterized protein n=1 Tax=Solanum verrucosum TaxID=315347 RepID=A0AAF1A3Z5_SOLVR|nr:hypothetical protein MTR67_053315 [Solanum verrucosum]